MIPAMNQNYLLSGKELAKLENYIKFFVHKSVQAIVQSRTDTREKTSSTASSGKYDWEISSDSRQNVDKFNLVLTDDLTVKAQLNKLLSDICLIPNFSLCLEILVRTPSNEQLVLECWHLTLADPCDRNITVSSVYPCMCVLLKSIISVSRVTPAFKMSSNQSLGCFITHYRLYFGMPQHINLGEDYQEHAIGKVVTPGGTLSVSLAFRVTTALTLSPQRIYEGVPFMMKSNYFDSDMSPKRSRAPTVDSYDADLDINNDLEDDLTSTGAFAPSSMFPDPSSFPDLILPEKSMLNCHTGFPSCIETTLKENSDNNANDVDNKELYFSDDVDYNCNENGDGATLSCSRNSDFGDFVMKPAFARCDSDNDLGTFIRVCHNASPIQSFAAQQSFEETVSDITNQLAQFETSMHDFDMFIDSVCHVDGEK